MSAGGKGSAPRPYSIDQKTFANNWDAIFGKKKKQEDTKTMPMPGTIGSAKLVFKDDDTDNESPEQKDSSDNK